MNNFRTVVVAIVSFLMVNSERLDGAISTRYFGGEGLFSAILVAFIASQMFRYLTKKGLGAIEFPDSVPASLKNSISALLPMAIVMASFTLLGGIFSIGIGKSFPAFILSICEPLNFAVNSIWGIALVSTLGQIAWWFGIHNMAIVSVVLPILYSNLAANADAYAAGVVGTNLPFIVNTAFFYTFCTIGGSGATLALAILLLKSKSMQMRTVGKLSIIPAYFGINEPVIFGLPIMLNPILLIPFIFVQIVNIIVTYMVMAAGLVGRPIFYLGANAPSLFGQFLSTMDWRAPVLWVILLLIDIVLWYPFFKTAEREKLEEESGKEQPVEPGEELQTNVL
jgi:PTS system cellobiose-specific IIC component